MSRELDAEVAELVMGDRFYFETTYRQVFGMDKWVHVRDTPKFSEDIAAAFQVVERMRALGWGVEIDDHCGWSCEFTNDRGCFVFRAADTLPKAISLAALAAVQHKEVEA